MERGPARASGQTRLAGPLPARLTAGAGLLVAVGVSILVGWVAPDDGATSISVRQGLAYGLVFAASPLGVLVARVPARAAAALGGGMTVAGAATMPGGNLVGGVMLATGFVILLTGTAAGTDGITRALLVRFVSTALLLFAGVVLALGVSPIGGAAAAVTAGVVVSIGRLR